MHSWHEGRMNRDGSIFSCAFRGSSSFVGLWLVMSFEVLKF
jgi:hypothetical protein